MNIIGIDVSKAELVCVLINRRGQVKDTYIIKNSKEDVKEWLSTLSFKKLTLGCEATGEYHNLLAKACLEQGLPLRVLNPIVTKQFTRATVRKKKTDLTDALVIAKCILQGEGYELTKEAFSNPAKRALRLAAELSRQWVALHLMEKRFGEHFPEDGLILEELTSLKVRSGRRHEEGASFGSGGG